MKSAFIRVPIPNWLTLGLAALALGALAAVWVTSSEAFAARAPLLLVMAAWLVAILLPGQPLWLRIVLAVAGWPILYYLEGSDPTGVVEAIQSLLIVYLLLASASRPGARERLVALGWPGILLAGFLGWTFLLAFAHTPDVSLGISDALKTLRFVPFVFILVMADLGDVHVRRYILPALILTAGGVALYGLYVTVQKGGLNPANLLRVTGTVIRLKVIFDNPNNLGTLLSTVLVFAGVYLVSVRAKWRWLALALPLLGAMTWAMLLTFSRRNWILAPLSFAVAVPFMRYRWRRIALIALGALAVAAALFVFRDLILSRFLDLLRFADVNARQTGGGLQVRLAQTQTFLSGFQTFTDYLIGVGSGAVGASQQVYQSHVLPGVDGYYFRLLGGYGIVGLLLYAGGALATLWRLLRSAARNRLAEGDHAIVSASLAGVTLILLSGTLSNTNITFPASLYLWLFAGLGLAASIRTQPAADSERT